MEVHIVTVKKLIAVGFIFICASVAWMILGAANMNRTDTAYSSLKQEVATLFGDSLDIYAPECHAKVPRTVEETVDGRRVVTTVYDLVPAEIAKTDARVSVVLDPRKKGNLWFPTFRARFTGEWVFSADKSAIPGTAPASGAPQGLAGFYVLSTLESGNSVYDNVSLAVNGEPVADVTPLIRKTEIPVVPNADGTVRLAVSYDVTGMEQLRYYPSRNPGEITQINDFNLTIDADFLNYDFPEGMMSPTERTDRKDGSELLWRFAKSVTGKDIGLTIPNKLNPGEIVTRVAFFAPVSLLFFLVALLVFTVVRNAGLHPMHYFFLAATFFSFHLMFSYFSDKWDIYPSFAVAALVSLALTVSYLARFADRAIAFVIAPAAQLVYLVIFSFSFFFDGMTGILVTVCAVVTLFILMQLTAGVNWDTAFGSGTKKIKD